MDQIFNKGSVTQKGSLFTGGEYGQVDIVYKQPWKNGKGGKTRHIPLLMKVNGGPIYYVKKKPFSEFVCDGLFYVHVYYYNSLIDLSWANNFSKYSPRNAAANQRIASATGNDAPPLQDHAATNERTAMSILPPLLARLSQSVGRNEMVMKPLHRDPNLKDAEQLAGICVQIHFA